MMVLRLILLLTTVLGALVASHVFIQRSLVRALGVKRPGARRLTLALAILLSLGFPTSMALLRSWPGALATGYHLVAAWWMGLFFHLLLALAAARLLLLVARRLGRPLPFRGIVLGAVAVAVAATALGAYRAAHPRVRRVEVALEGLPAAWRGRTIVHLSDLHLGHLRGPAFMERVARTVNALEPDAVLITGDLFDGLGGDFVACLGAVDALRSRHGTFAVTGNHELYAGAAPVLRRARLRLLRDEVVTIDGLQLVGVGYPGLSDEAALRRLAAALDDGRASVLLFHTPTSILQRGGDEVDRHVSTYWMPDTSCAVNRGLGVDLQLSGHTHAGQIFPLGLLTRLIYRGRDRGLHREGSFHLLVSSGTGTFGPPIRTAGQSEILAITLR
jgi:predicted MPP superfamily phosphohydrolase